MRDISAQIDLSKQALTERHRRREEPVAAGIALATPAEESLITVVRDLGPDLRGPGAVGSQSIDTRTQSVDRLKIQVIRAAVEAFSGREFSLLDPVEFALSSICETENTDENTPSSRLVSRLVYSYRDRPYEGETTSFVASGVAHTADDQQIDIDVQLTMGRQLLSKTSTEVRLGAVQDSLVINFEGTAAELADRTFAFDLDMDGVAEQIHFVESNSGFPAAGSELFGPRAGPGLQRTDSVRRRRQRFH